MLVLFFYFFAYLWGNPNFYYRADFFRFSGPCAVFLCFFAKPVAFFKKMCYNRKQWDTLPVPCVRFDFTDSRKDAV